MGNLSKLPERLKELMFDKGISAGELASAVYTKSEGKILSKGNYFMGILSKLPERLKMLMSDRCVNPPKLAKTLGIGSNTITRYVQGVSSPAYDIFIRLVEYFNCSADFLLGTGELPLYEKKFLSIPPFSVRLRQVIEECKTTQYALKKQTGLSWNNFHKWLNGKSLPSPDSLLTLATALEVSVDYLLGRIS